MWLWGMMFNWRSCVAWGWHGVAWQCVVWHGMAWCTWMCGMVVCGWHGPVNKQVGGSFSGRCNPELDNAPSAESSPPIQI